MILTTSETYLRVIRQKDKNIMSQHITEKCLVGVLNTEMMTVTFLSGMKFSSHGDLL